MAPSFFDVSLNRGSPPPTINGNTDSGAYVAVNTSPRRVRKLCTKIHRSTNYLQRIKALNRLYSMGDSSSDELDRSYGLNNPGNAIHAISRAYHGSAKYDAACILMELYAELKTLEAAKSLVALSLGQESVFQAPQVSELEMACVSSPAGNGTTGDTTEDETMDDLAGVEVPLRLPDIILRLNGNHGKEKSRQASKSPRHPRRRRTLSTRRAATPSQASNSRRSAPPVIPSAACPASIAKTQATTPEIPDPETRQTS